MSCQGLNFMPLEGAYFLLGKTPNIAEASQKLPPLLTSRAPPFEEALDCFLFSCTVYLTGTYVAPVSTVLVQYVVLEGDPIFHLI